MSSFLYVISPDGTHFYFPVDWLRECRSSDTYKTIGLCFTTVLASRVTAFAPWRVRFMWSSRWKLPYQTLCLRLRYGDCSSLSLRSIECPLNGMKVHAALMRHFPSLSL